MNNTILEIQNISKSFKGQIVLQDISFSLQQGTIVSLLGPNGVSKNTLMENFFRF
ncbi:ATP-binding cassette domain-containing protein [Lysinibacillus contaminans]|uniref:ATP-binding cassette domain-containing protein n=1 Tax=Lysinibacillus contaminans TaxID=1293441 RepID=UPI000A5133B9